MVQRRKIMKERLLDYFFEKEEKNTRYANLVYYSFIGIGLIMLAITVVNWL